jgi:hypothetical protein
VVVVCVQPRRAGLTARPSELLLPASHRRRKAAAATTGAPPWAREGSASGQWRGSVGVACGACVVCCDDPCRRCVRASFPSFPSGGPLARSRAPTLCQPALPSLHNRYRHSLSSRHHAHCCRLCLPRLSSIPPTFVRPHPPRVPIHSSFVRQEKGVSSKHSKPSSTRSVSTKAAPGIVERVLAACIEAFEGP